MLFSAILIALRQRVPFTNYPNATHYNSFSVDHVPFKLEFGNYQLVYVPSNASVVRQVAEDVQRSLGVKVITSGGYQAVKHYLIGLETNEGFIWLAQK